jgi:hypothetical protein
MDGDLPGRGLFDAEGATPDELGYVLATDPVEPREFRAVVERTLAGAFSTIDTSGDKAILVPAGPSTLDADVVPCVAMRRYDDKLPNLVVHQGSRLFPRSGGWIDNFPQQQYDNGVAKNTATGRRYKETVRGIKRLENEMLEQRLISAAIPGYLVECLVFNVPNDEFGRSRRLDDLRAVFAFLWNGLRDPSIYNDWREVNGLKWLFRGDQAWTPQQAFAFIAKAWDTVGVS